MCGLQRWRTIDKTYETMKFIIKHAVSYTINYDAMILLMMVIICNCPDVCAKLWKLSNEVRVIKL